MTKTILAAIVLAAAAGSASAMSGAQLTNAAQSKLDAYGIEADASDLTRNQIATIKFVDVSDNAAQVRAELRSAVK